MENHFLMYHELVMHRIVAEETNLYEHQKEALLAIYAKGQSGELTATTDKKAVYIGAGTACGKTLIQILTPYVLAPLMSGNQALFLSDNCTLKSRLVKDFPITKEMTPVYEDWLIYKLNVLPSGAQPPRLFVFDASTWKQTKTTAINADILVGNRQFIINLSKNGELEAYSDIGAIVTDEAHFAAAETYKKIFAGYLTTPLAYFTGSRYRSDRKPLPFVDYEEIVDYDEDGDEVTSHLPIADFEFTIQDAWNLKPSPIKRIAYKSAKSESFLIEDDGAEIEMSSEEFFHRATNDRQWLHNIILADSFCMPVLEMALDILMRKREVTKQPHCMLVRALNIKHCHRVAEILAENFPHLEGKIGVVHSEHKDFDLDGEPTEIIQNIQDSKYIVVIHCAILGVGFDYKWFSMSVCLGVLISMSTAEQEWGRCLRRVESDDPPTDKIDLMHPNQAVLITHDVLNIKDLFEKYIAGSYLKKVKLEKTEGEPKFFPVRVVEDYLPLSPTVMVSNTKNVKVGSRLKFLVGTKENQEVIGEATVLQIIGEKELAIEPIDQLIGKNTSVRVNRGVTIESIFLEHLNLDWLILVDGELVSYREYVQKVNQENNPLFPCDDVEIPHPPTIIRPDLVQLGYQRKYSNILKAVVAKELNKLPDQAKGSSLLEQRDHPLFQKTLETASSHNKEIANNMSLALAAMFSRIRATTKKEWSDHIDEADYKNATSIGFGFIKELKECIEKQVS